MVRVQVADDDRIEVRRVEQPGEPGERALPEVEQEGALAVRQEVGRAGRPGAVRVRGPGADDREDPRPVSLGAGATSGRTAVADGEALEPGRRAHLVAVAEPPARSAPRGARPSRP